MILNDAELRQLTGRPNLLAAAREVLSWAAPASSPPGAGRGPSVVVAKQGEYGAALITEEGFFALPAYPLETVIDPTGAGDTFAGGLVGYIAAHPREELSDGLLRRAMAHATVLASFNVEEFGTERVERLTGPEIVDAHRRAARDHPVQRHPGQAAALKHGEARTYLWWACGYPASPWAWFARMRIRGLYGCARPVYDRLK